MSTKKFKVSIGHRSVAYYIVEADSAAEAEAKAEELHGEGAEPSDYFESEDQVEEVEPVK